MSVGSATSIYTNGSCTIEVITIESGGVETYNINLSLSGGNFIDNHTRGTYTMRQGRSDTYKFIPLDVNDPVKVFVNDVDMSSLLTSQSISNSIEVDERSDAQYGFTLDSSDNYWKS
jgi:hypothetical protein